MSTYKIYRSEGLNPVQYGKRKRQLNVLTYTSIPSVTLFYNLDTFNIISVHYLVHVLLMSTALIALFILYRNLHKTRKNINEIGKLSLRQSSISSDVEGIKNELSLSEIDHIKLEKHIPGGMFTSGKHGYFSYLLHIHSKDKPTVSYVLSSQSSNSGMDLKTNLDFLISQP